MRSRKWLSGIVATLFLFSSATIVYARPTAPENSVLTQTNYANLKQKAKQKQQPMEDTAREALLQLGLSPSLTEQLSSEKLRSVYFNRSLTNERRYLRVAPDGTKTEVTREQCIAGVQAQNQKAARAAARGSVFDYENHSRNAYMEVSMLGFQLYDANGNRQKGEYGYIGMYQWLALPTWRGTDVMGIVASSGSVKPNSAECITYSKCMINLNGSQRTQEYNDYYYPSGGSGVYEHFLTSVVFKIKLPMNTQGSQAGNVTYTEFSALVYAEGVVPNKWTNCNYNVSAQYFHQSLLLLTSLSISVSGGSISVAPKIVYNSNYPKATIAISYNP